MNKYSEGKIYKIISSSTEDIYIGSTYSNRLSSRMIKHRHEYKNYLKDHTRRYYSSFEILRYEDAEIILIENFPCKNKDELRSREQFWIESLPNCINKQRAYRSEDYKIKYGHEYNVTKRRERNSIKMKCDCGMTYTKDHRKRHESTFLHQTFLYQNI